MESVIEAMPQERRAGRPYIGPKAQTHIWAEIHYAVRKEAEERGVPMADIWREMLEEAWTARGGKL